MPTKSPRIVENRFALLGAVILSVLLLALWLYLVRKAPPPITPESALTPSSLPRNWRDDGSLEDLRVALRESLAYFERLPADSRFQFGPRTASAGELRDGYRRFLDELEGLTEITDTLIRSHFEIFESTAPRVLFTGYFEAELRGSRTKSDRFFYPLYRKPPDLLLIRLSAFFPQRQPDGIPTLLRGRLAEGQTVVPYFDRRAIDREGVLTDPALVIAWVDDPVAAFFLHIQGSGVITLDDGSTIGVSYAESNGHPYRAIGKLLIDRGVLTRETTSMQTIQSYVRTHPELQAEIFDYNPSYIFFRERTGGARGSLDLPITAGRSIATDQSLFPRGALALISIPGNADRGEITRLVLNQDTGGAIRGPGRVDYFTGRGAAAEALAGPLQERGTLYFLLPRGSNADG